jgi:uncharacterized repeat protein (TIGR01451 family)
MYKMIRYHKYFLGLIFFAVFFQTGKAQQFNPVAWPSDAQWRAYTIKDTIIADPAVQDPSNGGTSPQNYVNISSGTPDQSQPSVYFSYLNSTIFVRFRIESSPNAYTAGNNAGNGDPWKQATWIMMLDVNGDGWRDYAIYLDGVSGTPSTPIDRIKIIYSRLTNTQTIAPQTGVYELGEIYAAQPYTSGPYNGQLKQYDGNGNLVAIPWQGTITTWDYGTTRTVQLPDGQYFIDFQIPISALNASAYNGPVFTPSTVFTAVFTTANSNTNPFQKDYAYLGPFCPSETSPFASGDPETYDASASIPKIVVTQVTAAYCPTVNLSTSVITSQRLIDCSTVASSVVTNNFYYWYDQNGNGLADETGGQWTLIGAGSPTTIGTWTATWNTSSLPRGKYLIKVIAQDQNGNSTDSYLQTVSQYPNVYAIISNDCGIIPATLSKSVNISTVQANQPAANRTVTYTITVTNPQSNSIALDTLTDVLPNTFTYLKDTTGGTLTPTTSPVANSTGTIRWIFNPSDSISAGTSMTLKFNVLAGTTTGTYLNSVYAKGSTYFNAATNTAQVTVTNAAATLTKTTSAVAGMNPGDSTTYTLSYQNTGTVTLTNVVITDSLVQGLSDNVTVSNGGTYNAATRTITWNVGTVSAGTGSSVSAIVKITNPYNGTNPLNNSGKLTASELVNAVTSNTVQNSILGPVLSLSKSVSPTSSYPGNNVTFTILYGNNGTGPAHSVVLRDTIPANLKYVSGSASTTPSSIDSISVPGKQILTWNLGTVNAGGNNINNSITFQTSIANPYPTVGENQPLVNKVIILSNETSALSANATLLVTAIPTVSITKTSNQQVYVTSDTNATFTLTLSNSGYYTATIDSLEDVLPNNFQYEWTNGGTLYSNVTSFPTANSTGTVRWKFSTPATLSPNQSKTLTFKVKTPIVGVNYTNIGRAYGVLTSASKGSVSATLPIGIAENEEVMVKSVNKTTAYVGDTLIYTLYYLNNSGTTQSRTMTDTLSSSLNYIGATPSRGTVSNSGLIITWNPGNVGNGNSASLQIYAIVVQGGVVIPNYAWFNRTPVTQTNTVTTTSLLAPAITLTKSVDITSAPVKTVLTYTIDYSNAPGVTSSTNSVIVDTIPPYLTYVVGSVTGGGSFVGSPSPRGRVVWNLGTVNANTSGSVSFQVKIDTTAPINSYITNKAIFTNDQGTSKNSSVVDTVKAVPSFTLTKTVNVVTAGPADTITYTIKYVNTGTASGTSTFIYDTIPANTVYVSDSSGGVISGGRIVWNIGTVAVNDSGSRKLAVRLPKPLAYNSISQISNRAYIASLGIPDKASSPALTNVIYPQLAAVKSVDSSTAHSKSIITYTIVVSNATISAATNAKLYDTIPIFTTYVPNSTKINNVVQSDTLGTSKLVTGLPLGTVVTGTNVTVKFQVQINAPIANGTVIPNKSWVTTDKLTAPIQGTTVTTTALSSPSLYLKKTASMPHPVPGDTITYSLQYGNLGTDTAKTVVIADTLSANTVYVTGSLTGTGASYLTSPQRIVVSRSTILIGDTSNIVTFKVRVNTPLTNGTNTIFNKAYASASNASTVVDSVSTNVIASSSISLVKTAQDTGWILGSPTPADTFTYTVTYQIVGTAVLDSVYLNDTLQMGLTYLSSTLNGSSGGSANGQAVEWNIGTANPGDTGRVTVTVRTTAENTYSNRLIATSRQDPRGDTSNTKVTYIIKPKPVFTTSSKSVVDNNGGVVEPPDSLTYTIVVRNTSIGIADSVSVVDSLPPHVTILSSTLNPSGSVNGQVITFNKFNLSGHDSTTLSYKVSVDSSITNNVAAINRAHIVSDGVDQLVSASFTPVNRPTMTMTKSVSSTTGRMRPGDTLVYTINYKNIGTTTATFVSVSDPNPNNTTYVPESVTLNAVHKTDAADADEVTVSSNIIQVNVGTVTPGQAGTITYRVRIN